jgi:hypothetical protein
MDNDYETSDENQKHVGKKRLSRLDLLDVLTSYQERKKMVLDSELNIDPHGLKILREGP